MSLNRNRVVRVVHVTLGLEVGGQERWLVEMARHADRRSFDLHFVSLSSRGALGGDIEGCGWPVTALGAPDGLRPSLTVALTRHFARLRPDVVHTHDERPLIYAAPAARLAGARSVLHTRHSQGSRLTGRQRWLVRLAAACTDRFVCVSADSARWAVRQGVPRRKVAVVPNGIDLGGPPPGPSASGPAVLVARLAPEKDVGTLLKAASLVARLHPDFRLEIAGDGPCRGDLQGQAAELGLGEHVRFLGPIRDVKGLLGRARMFVLPSLTEGASLTLLEAMAGGLPVVATRVGGNPEVVADGETGLLVAPSAPATLAAAIAGLWSQPGTCSRFGAEGRRRAEAHFDVRRMVSRYEALYPA